MKIRLTKRTNERHALEIIRDDGTREQVELETKSLWLHDFIHLAVESEAGLSDGFWGSLAAGKTLAKMNPTSSQRDYAGQANARMEVIEMLVGALSGVLNGLPRGTHERTLHGVSYDEAVANIRGYLESVGKGDEFPAWLTPEFVVRVQERLRKLIGHWNATPFGEAMELEW